MNKPASKDAASPKVRKVSDRSKVKQALALLERKGVALSEEQLLERLAASKELMSGVPISERDHRTLDSALVELAGSNGQMSQAITNALSYAFRAMPRWTIADQRNPANIGKGYADALTLPAFDAPQLTKEIIHEASAERWFREHGQLTDAGEHE